MGAADGINVPTQHLSKDGYNYANPSSYNLILMQTLVAHPLR